MLIIGKNKTIHTRYRQTRNGMQCTPCNARRRCSRYPIIYEPNFICLKPEQILLRRPLYYKLSYLSIFYMQPVLLRVKFGRQKSDALQTEVLQLFIFEFPKHCLARFTGAAEFFLGIFIMTLFIFSFSDQCSSN